MKIESNPDILVHVDAAPGMMITPALTPDFWLYRVPLSDKQAIVCFPKFATLIGIGFQYEEDWNTNLPHTCDAREIYEHIKHNKGDDGISDDDCVKAIEALQAVIKQALAAVAR
jgi:hypothetical protein